MNCEKTAPKHVRRVLASARSSRSFHGLFECLERQREVKEKDGGFDPGNLVNDRGVKLMRDSEEVKDYLGRLREIAAAEGPAENRAHGVAEGS